MLDEAGLTECKIVASNALDEYIIRDLVRQGARIDSFGVGERLITSRSAPVFGGVYKLVAVEDENGTVSMASFESMFTIKTLLVPVGTIRLSDSASAQEASSEESSVTVRPASSTTESFAVGTAFSS